MIVGCNLSQPFSGDDIDKEEALLAKDAKSSDRQPTGKTR